MSYRSKRLTTGVWRLLRGMLDPITAEKIQILGSSFEGKLLEVVEPHQLLREYGGTNDFDQLRQRRSLDECRELIAAASAQHLLS